MTELVKTDGPNSLALEITPPDLAKDLHAHLVDLTGPPDRGLGIWRDVYLTKTGPVALRFPQVATQLDLPAATTAHLTVRAELRNAAASSVEVSLKGTIDQSIAFAQTVTIAAGERKWSASIHNVPSSISIHPTLWWPRIRRAGTT